MQDSHRTPARVEALGNYQYLVSNFAVDSPRLKAEVRTHPTLVRMIDRLQADSSLQFELVGYSDCLGQEGRNRTLRQEREQRVWNSLPKALRSRGKLRGGAELSECVDSNQTQSGRARNRSVMINIILVFEGDEITGDPCSPQALPSRASSMDQYLGLVRCVERAYPHYSYRQILSLLRQIYYGHETWSRSRTRHWQNVIPCGLSIPDPRGHLGNRLFRALQDSQESIWIPSPQSNREPIDIGHVYTGIEAMLCPIRQVELEVFGPNPVVNMPNEEFATWGGGPRFRSRPKDT